MLLLSLLTNGSKQHLKLLPVLCDVCECTTIFFHHHYYHHHDGMPIHQHHIHNKYNSHSSTLLLRLLPLRRSSSSSLSSRRPRIIHRIHCNNNHSILRPSQQHPLLQRIQHIPPPPPSSTTTRYLTTTTTHEATTTTSSSSSSSQHVLLEHLTRKFDNEKLKDDDVDDDDDMDDSGTPTRTISILTLNRPDAENAMGHQMIQELQECIEHIEQQLQQPQQSPSSSTSSSLSTTPTTTTSLSNTATRCVIVTSASRRFFCTGADLKERSQMTLPQAKHFVTKLRDTFHRFIELPIPIIAAIEGAALGGGLELALAADIRIASAHNARFGLPERSLAIVPSESGTQELSRLMNIVRVKQMIFTSQYMQTRTAYQYGWIQHVVPDGTTLSFATDMAWKIALNRPDMPLIPDMNIPTCGLR